MTVDELKVLITADIENLRKGIQKANSTIASLQKQATKTSSSIFSAVLKGNIATKILSKGIALVSQNMDNAINRLDALNNFPRVMKNLGISSEDAEASMQRLSDKLVGLPTTLNDATMSVQRFTSANGNVKASTEMFLALNNAILSGGANTQIQASALEQLSQAYAKGKPDMMEWRTAMMAMPAQMKQVALAMGYVSADQLGQALRNGQVSMNEFMKTIIDLNKTGANGFESFEVQARSSTGGVATSMTNVKTAVTRGLADIMNAIGQSNIAGFFQGIARAINNVIPYVTAFVKVMVTAVSFITSLFGKTKAVNNTVNDTATSMNNLGSSSKSTSTGLDKTTGSAKKLNKELGKLASFDEMTVLTENSSDSGGGNTGASGGVGDLGNIDLSGFDTAISTTNTKVDDLYNKMLEVAKWFTSDMNFQPLIDSFYNLSDAISYLCNGMGGLLRDFITNYIKPLATYVINDALPHFFNSTAEAIKGIDFSTISNALNKLWKALEPFTETVGEGLLWIYDHAILPLSQIVINDIVPAFLNLLAGAINVLNTAINEVKPVFEWLWTSFLEPIVSWTGGVIGDVLTAIGDALSWIAQNEVAVTILEGLVIAIGLVTGALGLYNIAMNISNIAMGIWNGICAIGTAVTTAFSTAMTVLTSPITLVILAIAGIVAVVILLVKHWDEVKEVASNVWNKIKEVWSVVADWFNEHVIEPIKAFFTPIIDFFKDIFTTAVDNIKTIFNNVVSIASNIWNSIKNVFSAVGTFFKNVFTNAYDNIKNVFNKVVTFFGSIFDKIKNIFIKIGTTVGNVISGAFKGVINGVLGTIENVLNSPIKAINGLINVINKVPGINLGKLSTFNLPRLARGGIVDRPTLAQIGEAGKEVVMPLERNTGWINQLADKIDERIDGSNSQPIQLVVKIGEDTIFDKMINNIKEKNFETNGEVFI